MALIDSRGKIVAVNKEWVFVAKQAGIDPARVGPGVNYLEVCRRAGGASVEPRKALTGICDVLKENSPSFSMDYACDTPSGPAFFRMGVTPIPYENARVAISHTDITDLQLEKIKDFDRVQELARRLIHAQERERQRIAREIHDDLGSRIAFMSFWVRRIIEQGPQRHGTTANELIRVVDGLNDLSQALRSLSHDLHPPSLRYVGIDGALRSLRTSFEQSSNIDVDLRLPAQLPKLPDDIELCVFRISQECLQNIAKHSGARKAKIALEYSPSRLQLTVSDRGKGFNRSHAIHKGGVGLLSIEERALSIGGEVTVTSSPGAGTEVRLIIPLRKESLEVMVR